MRSKNDKPIIQTASNAPPQFSKRIQSLMNNRSSLSFPQPESILSEIQQFHQYYNARYQQLKLNYDQISKQNWEYTNKLLQYEQKFQQYQQALYLVNKKAENLEIQVENLSGKSQKLTNYKEFEGILQIKDEEIENLKLKIKQLSQARDSKETSERQTVVKRYKITSTSQNSNTPRQLTTCPQKKDQGLKVCKDEGLKVSETSRAHYKISAIKEENDELIHQNNELIKQADHMRKRIKNLEANKKYEDDRLKNATLSLQLDLEIKNQQISRLSHQIQVYQAKFHEAINTFARNDKNKAIKKINNENHSVLNFIVGNEEKLDVELDEQHTNPSTNNYQQSIVNEECTERTEKKSDLGSEFLKVRHKRNFSSNLQNYDQKEKIDLKVKVLRFDKNKRKF